MKYNKKMENLAKKKEIKIYKDSCIIEVFGNIVDSGFVVNDECTYIKSLFEKNNSKKTLACLYDDTDRECWMNSIHIEDWYRGDLISAAYSLSFFIFNKLKLTYEDKLFSCVISAENRKNVVWKLYTVRHGVEWLSSDLEKYDQAILQVFSNEYVMPILSR